MTREGALMDAADDAHRRASAKVAALLGEEEERPQRGPLHPAVAKLAQVEEALTEANRRGLELDGAVIELQAALADAVKHLRRPLAGMIRDRWRERLGAYWPQDAG